MTIVKIATHGRPESRSVLIRGQPEAIGIPDVAAVALEAVTTILLLFPFGRRIGRQAGLGAWQCSRSP